MLNTIIVLTLIQVTFFAFHIYVTNRGYGCYSFKKMRAAFLYLPLVVFLASIEKVPFYYLYIYTFFAIEYALSMNIVHSLWQVFQFYILRREVPLVKHTPVLTSIRIFSGSLQTDFHNLEAFINCIVNKMPVFSIENADTGATGEGMPFDFKLFQLGYIEEITFLALFLGLVSFI